MRKVLEAFTRNLVEQNHSLTPAQGRQNSRVGCLLTTTTTISYHIKGKPFISANPHKDSEPLNTGLSENEYFHSEIYESAKYLKLTFKLRHPISNRGLIDKFDRRQTGASLPLTPHQRDLSERPPKQTLQPRPRPRRRSSPPQP